MDPILAAAQTMLNTEGDGWQVTAYVIVLGCERVINGHVESQAFRYAANDQPRWVTNGLLDDVEQLRDIVEDAD